MWSTPAEWKQYNKMAVLHFFLVNSSLCILFSMFLTQILFLSCSPGKTIYAGGDFTGILQIQYKHIIQHININFIQADLDNTEFLDLFKILIFIKGRNQGKGDFSLKWMMGHFNLRFGKKCKWKIVTIYLLIKI